MRMWLTPPSLLCRKHLLGEHVEMHMFVGALRHGNSIQGYIDGALVEVERITSRHDELVAEMLKRQYHHRSPLGRDVQELLWSAGKVDPEANLRELARRCPECRTRIQDGAAKAFLEEGRI